MTRLRFDSRRVEIAARATGSEPDTIEATLDWWRDGRWQPFGSGRFTVVRVPG